MKLKLLKGLTLALAFTLVGTAAVPADAANTNGDVIDEEMLDGEMDMDEVVGSEELVTDPEDIDDESEDSEEELDVFNMEGFIDGFSVEAFKPHCFTDAPENDPVNTAYDDYSLQTCSCDDGSVTEVNVEEVSNQSEMDEILENMEKVGSYTEELGDGLVIEVTEYVKKHQSLSQTNVNKVEYTLSYEFREGSTVHIQYILGGLFKYNGRTSSCVNVYNYYHRSTAAYKVSYSARSSENIAYGTCTLRNAKTGKVTSHKNFKLWVTASGKVYRKIY